jgi:hypothetical protein
MERMKLAWLVVLCGVVLGSVVVGEVAHAQNCLPPHRMAITDLDMIPDPVPEGQPIEAWKVTIRSDRNGECTTILEIRDQDQIVGLGAQHRIKPGRGSYRIQAAPGYQFQGRDACFVVQANVGGFLTPLDAQRVFCAKASTVTTWSLREPRDWWREQRRQERSYQERR